MLFQAFLLRWQRRVAASGDAPQRRRRGAAVGRSVGSKRGCEAPGRGLALEFFPHSNGRFRIGEEDRSERERGRSGGDQLEPVGTCFDPAHPDDGQSGRTIGGEDGSERDRPEHRTGEAPDPGAELRRERALVENEAADGVHEREAVRPGTRRGSRSRADIGDRGRELRVERLRRRSSRGLRGCDTWRCYSRGHYDGAAWRAYHSMSVWVPRSL